MDMRHMSGFRFYQAYTRPVVVQFVDYMCSERVFIDSYIC